MSETPTGVRTPIESTSERPLTRRQLRELRAREEAQRPSDPSGSEADQANATAERADPAAVPAVEAPEVPEADHDPVAAAAAHGLNPPQAATRPSRETILLVCASVLFVASLIVLLIALAT